jgi:chromobox protein 1
VTVFQEYKKGNRISGDSVSGPSPTEVKRDQLKVTRHLDTKTNRGKPTSAKKADFKPPTGSWEEYVQQIDACEEKDGTVSVYLTWEGGQKTRHTLNQVYNRCPQRVRYKTTPHSIYTY